MKWVFVIAFAVAALLLAYAKVTMPEYQYEGVCQLVWATDDNPVRREQIDLFKAWHLRNYGEKIDVRVDPANSDSNKVVVQSIAGVGPDVFDTYGRGSLESYVKSGIILDITDEARERGFSWERVWPAVRSSFVFEGRQYGFPDNCNAHAMLYQRDLFAAAGVPEPRPGWTWDDFLEIAPKLSGKTPGGQKRFALCGLDPLVLLHQNGGRMFNADGTRCIVNSPEAVEAMRFYVDLRKKYKAIASPADMASQASAGGYGGDEMNMFAAGYYAMACGGRYWFIRYAETAGQLARLGKPSPFNIGVAEIPRFAGKPNWNAAGARVTGVNRNSHHIKYALRFVEFLASEDFNRQVNESFDALPGVMEYCTGPRGIAWAQPPAGLEAANDPIWTTVMGYAHEQSASPFVPSPRVGSLWSEMIGRIDAGVDTPQDMLDELARLVNDEMARNIAANPSLRERYEQLTARGDKP